MWRRRFDWADLARLNRWVSMRKSQVRRVLAPHKSCVTWLLYKLKLEAPASEGQCSAPIVLLTQNQIMSRGAPSERWPRWTRSAVGDTPTNREI